MTGSARGGTRRFALFLVVGIVVLMVCAPKVSGAQDFIKPSEARAHVGQHRTVCGHVASAMFAAKSRGQPTFLNLDHPYPNQIFMVLIWGRNRTKFETTPEALYRGKHICVVGLISAYKGVPQIVVDEPSQVSLR